MISLKRTDSQNEDFVKLVAALDAGLRVTDGEDHYFYAQFNKIDNIKNAIVAYHNETPVGCGAIKKFGEQGMEVKRMFVLPEVRGKGIATKILKALEEWASELGCEACFLETGKKQPEAINLYKKNGYKIILNYGQYIGVENSVCFRKNVSDHKEVILSFRTAEISDIPEIMIIRHSVKENVLSNPHLITNKDCETYLTERGKGWVCEISNQIVGFSIVDLQDDNIWALFVRPEFENKGIGKRLYKIMLDWYFGQQKDRVWLGTSPDTQAEQFYRKQGWKEIGTHGDGEIKFEMTLEDWKESISHIN